MPTLFSVVAVALLMACAGWGAGVRVPGWAGEPPAGEEPRALVPNTAVVGVPKEDAWWRGRHEAFNARAAEVAREGGVRMVFLGDSITQGWGEAGRGVWERYYSDRGAVNFGISGDRTQHLLWRIENGNLDGMAAPASGEAPGLVVVMIGTNNAPESAGNTGEEIGAGIVAVVEKVREKLPRAKVLVLGILPRGEAGDPMRERNARASEIAAAYAQEEEAEGEDGGMVRFLDLGERFVGEDGAIPRELMPDLLHLSERGYELWAEGMEGTVRGLLGEE